MAVAVSTIGIVTGGQKSQPWSHGRWSLSFIIVSVVGMSLAFELNKLRLDPVRWGWVLIYFFVASQLLLSTISRWFPLRPPARKTTSIGAHRYSIPNLWEPVPRGLAEDLRELLRLELRS